MQLPYIASIKNKTLIDETCKDLKTLCGLDYFIIYILFKNKQVFVLSNVYSHLNDYYHNTMYKHDHSISRAFFESKNFYLCEEDKGISSVYSDLLQTKHRIHRVFYKMLQTPEFDIFLGAANKTPIKDKLRFFQKVSDDFNHFALRFIVKHHEIFIHHNPELKNSNYFNSAFLKRLILNSDEIQCLTPREMECLKRIAQGYTTNDIANLLGNSKHTIEEHRKSILKKLNAANIANAIYIAMNRGIFEERQSLILPNVDSIQDFRNLSI